MYNDADVSSVEISEEESGHSDGPMLRATEVGREAVQNVEQSQRTQDQTLLNKRQN
jgi:hypothetical protein